MGWSDELQAELSDNAFTRGTAVMIEIESEHVTEVFSRVGERGVRAEVIAENAADEALAYLKTEAPVGHHLADQLLIPLALCRGGSFTNQYCRHPEIWQSTSGQHIRQTVSGE
jgi:RNA 3'-terminal phosphate cyclase (ATP)